MIATAGLPVVRARVSSPDLEDYRRRRAPEFATRGVPIPSERPRPVGARVRLKIELADGTLGYDGEALVVSHVGTPRPGYLLKLLGPAGGRGAPPPERAARPPLRAPDLGTAPEPTPEPVLVPTPEPRPLEAVGRRADPVPAEASRLADLLFSDLNLADPTHPGLAVKAPDRAAATPRLASLPPDHAGADGAAEDGPPAAGPRRPPPVLAAMAEPEPPPEPGASGRALAALRLRHPAALAAAVLVCVAVGTGTIVLAAGPSRAEARAADLVAELRRADDRLRAGRLAGTGNDSALDHLAAARELVPDDPRLIRRLKLLADVLGDLGERALARGDLEEAAVHFQATLRAEPGSELARRRLREIADRTPATAAGRWPAPGR